MTTPNPLKTALLFLLIFPVLFSCKKEEEIVIYEPAGSSSYFINNQTNEDVILIYTKSAELGFEKDTTEVIKTNTTVRIFEDGIIGSKPLPINTFSEIKFYKSSDLTTPFKVLSPVENEDWTIVNHNLPFAGTGWSYYEIKLTE